jgi:DNA uptake protein ComE-like DNA-binding protein
MMYANPIGSAGHMETELSLTGNCGYSLEHGRVVVTIDEITNRRSAENLSGTLSIELWALNQPYSGGGFSGEALAGTRIGELAGQHLLANCRYDLLFDEAPAGTWHLVLMLREWDGVGYVTRDYVNFAIPYVVASRSAVVVGARDNVISVRFPGNEEVSAAAPEERAPARTEPQAATEASRPGTPAADRASAGNRPQSAHEAAPPEASPPKPSRAASAAAVSLNAASTKEIAGIKGISRKLAENLVAARPFTSFDEVLAVKGVGAKLLQKLRKLVTL